MVECSRVKYGHDQVDPRRAMVESSIEPIRVK